MIIELRGAIENHRKLLSMINEQKLPIKATLMEDVNNIEKMVEKLYKNSKQKD